MGEMHICGHLILGLSSRHEASGTYGLTRHYQGKKCALTKSRQVDLKFCSFNPHLFCLRIWSAPWLSEGTIFSTSAPQPTGPSPLCSRRGSGVLEPGWKSTAKQSLPPNPGGSRWKTPLFLFGKDRAQSPKVSQGTGQKYVIFLLGITPVYPT